MNMNSQLKMLSHLAPLLELPLFFLPVLLTVLPSSPNHLTHLAFSHSALLHAPLLESD